MTKKITTGLIIAVFAILAFLPVEAAAQSRKQRRRARDLLAQGDTLYRQKNYEAAILKYAEALAITPKSPLAHYNKGLSHFNLRKYDEAILEFTISLDQGYNRATVYSVRWRAYFAKKELDLAMTDVREGQNVASNNPYFHLAEGQVLHEQKQYQPAVDAYTLALEMGSRNRNIQYLLALSYNGLSNWNKQAEFADIALKSGTNYPDMAWFLLGDAQQRMRQYEDAMRSYENSMSTGKKLYGVFINLAETYRILNRVRDAIDIAKQGMEVYPKDSTLRVNISWYYSLTDKHPEAILYAREAIRLAPTQYLGYTNLCRAYNDTGQYQLAVQNCRKALELQPGDGETNFYLGRNYQLQKDTDTALEYYNEAVKGLLAFTAKNPNYADGFYLLGNAYSVTDRRRQAIDAYQKSLEIAPMFARARFNLGIVYLRDGNKAAARRQQAALEGIDAQLAKKLGEAINR